MRASSLLLRVEGARAPSVGWGVARSETSAPSGGSETLMAKMHDPHYATVEALAEALEARDSYTAGHGVRVADLAIQMAELLHLPSSETEILRWGARLHDIGKVGIPDSILLKPAPLTEQECGFMKIHTGIGRRILSRVPGLEPLLAIVELHHENFDGSGYPYGLRGESIPMPARIVRVADAFDAMITHRVYRPAFSVERAIQQIKSGTGRAFDPDAAAAFEAIVSSSDYASSLSRLLTATGGSDTLLNLQERSSILAPALTGPRAPEA